MIKKRMNKGKIMLSQDEIINLNLYELTLLSTIKHIIISNYDSSDIKEIKLNDVLAVLNNGKELPRNNLRRDLSKSFRSLMSKDVLNIVNKVGKRYYVKRKSVLVGSDNLYISITQDEFKDFFSINLTSNLVKVFGYYIERESVLVGSDNLYISITQDEFKDFFSTNLTSNLVKIYGYYIKLLSTFDIHTKVGFYSLDKLSEKFNMSKSSLIRYNSELEKRNLISIHRRKTFDESTGKFKSFNNVYFKPCDKEHICNWFKIDIDLEQTNK